MRGLSPPWVIHVMSDLIEKLWPAFEAEVGEQLEQLEQMLARGPAAADIHFLFRQYRLVLLFVRSR